jgi:hypothetical protein
MAIQTELTLRLPNSPGALAGVCALLASERVNILALSLESNGSLRLVVDNHVHAAGALRERHYQVLARDVIVLKVSNAAGGLAPVMRSLADANVNIDYAYGGAPETSATGNVVLGVEEPSRAAAAAGV